MSKKVLVAMSGGVDSAVAVYLAQQMGYECVGATMRLYDGDGCDPESDINDAKAVADRLSIRHFVLDFRQEFKKYVIDNFVTAYENGKTPNPCIECNRFLKFDMMLKEADKLGADFIATGHYAVIDKKDGWYYLKKARDLAKDQSYVLYTLGQHILSRTLFPLGELTKTQIREIAAQQGFLNASKKESQDICFVANGDYASFIENYSSKVYPPGDFVDGDGNVIGRHSGIIRYTIGQRKGLGVTFGKPMYVSSKNAKTNTVSLCSNDELFSSCLEAGDFNWLIPNPSQRIRCGVKVRYNMKEQPAVAVRLDDGGVRIDFDDPQRAITLGQSAVLYLDNTVIGGGIITKTKLDK